MKGKTHAVHLTIESADRYKTYLELIVYDYAGVSKNIAHHLCYLEHLYQLKKQIPITDYSVLHGLRLKTIITEIASCAEVLLFDAIVNLTVKDNWDRACSMTLDKKVGFYVLLRYASEFGVIDKSLHGRLSKLFELRHKIHLTHGASDPYEFNDSLLRDSERTFEDLIIHFVKTRQRKISMREPITKADLLFPWGQ